MPQSDIPVMSNYKKVRDCHKKMCNVSGMAISKLKMAMHSCNNFWVSQSMHIEPLSLHCMFVTFLLYFRFLASYDGSNDVSVVEKYSTQTNSWSQVSSMGTRRSCLGVVMCNGLIYAVGGYDGASCLNTAERYDPLTDTWTSIAAMTIKRRYVKLAVVGEYPQPLFCWELFSCTFH